MTYLRISGPAGEPVTPAEARAHLRLAAGTEDPFLEGLIRAAREEVERATGLVFIRQDWRLCLDRWPGPSEVVVRRYPVQAILSVTAFGNQGEAWLIDPATYHADLGSRPARLLFGQRPGRLRPINGIEVDFRAGYGETGAQVPEILRRAILLAVAHWFEHRAPEGRQTPPLPPAFERLIAGHRDRRL